METNPYGWDVYNPDCPSRVLLDRIGDRWTVLIVGSLASGRKRFSELRNRIGVTPKVLTQSLRALERDGIIEREVFAEVPPRVEYWLTPLGEALQEPIETLREWAQTHVPAVLEARSRYEARAS